MIYSTDGEHKLKSESETAAMVEFYRDADLLVFDSMYSLNEMMDSKSDWGHSSNIVGVDLCLRAQVKHYCMFHHEPSHNDDTITRSSAKPDATPKSPVKIILSKYRQPTMA